MCVLLCRNDHNSCPNPEEETHPDHRTAPIQAQHFGRAPPEDVKTDGAMQDEGGGKGRGEWCERE